MGISAPAAIIGSSLIGAGASIYGAKKASGAQTDAAQQAIALQQRMYDTTRGDLAPYRTLGEKSINPLMGLAGLSGDPAQIQAQLAQMPGYQFALSQGLRGAQQSATARGLGLSGAALKGAEQFATGLADQTYGNQFNRLLGLTQLGQSAAAQTGSFGANAANQMSAAYGNIGDANAAFYNSIGTGVTNAANSVPTALFLNRLLGSGAPQQPNPGLYGQTPNPYELA